MPKSNICTLGEEPSRREEWPLHRLSLETQCLCPLPAQSVFTLPGQLEIYKKEKNCLSRTSDLSPTVLFLFLFSSSSLPRLYLCMLHSQFARELPAGGVLMPAARACSRHQKRTPADSSRPLSVQGAGAC